MPEEPRLEMKKTLETTPIPVTNLTPDASPVDVRTGEAETELAGRKGFIDAGNRAAKVALEQVVSPDDANMRRSPLEIEPGVYGPLDRNNTTPDKGRFTRG